MPDPTPGQVAYDIVNQRAYFGTQVPWTDLEPRERRAWEAAAQAVLERQSMLCPICATALERCNAQGDPP